jgi:hypothetical protein
VQFRRSERKHAEQIGRKTERRRSGWRRLARVAGRENLRRRIAAWWPSHRGYSDVAPFGFVPYSLKKKSDIVGFGGGKAGWAGSKYETPGFYSTLLLFF